MSGIRFRCSFPCTWTRLCLAALIGNIESLVPFPSPTFSLPPFAKAEWVHAASATGRSNEMMRGESKAGRGGESRRAHPVVPMKRAAPIIDRALKFTPPSAHGRRRASFGTRGMRCFDIISSLSGSTGNMETTTARCCPRIPASRNYAELELT